MCIRTRSVVLRSGRAHVFDTRQEILIGSSLGDGLTVEGLETPKLMSITHLIESVSGQAR